MRIAIDFNRKPNRWAKEIDDRERFKYHMLTPEFILSKLAIGESPPQTLLGLGRIAPHFLRALQKLNLSHRWHPPPQPLP